MSLKEYLYKQMSRPYLDATLLNTTDDNQTLRDDWVQYVRDHLPSLKKRCMIYDVSETVMPNVRQNLLRYMAYKGIDSQLWWIVLELNGFRFDRDFDRNLYPRDDNESDVYMRIYLPPIEEIETMHLKWMTICQNSTAGSLATRL